MTSAGHSQQRVAALSPIHDLPDMDPIDDLATRREREAQSKHRHITIGLGGDLGFGGSRQPVAADAGMRHGRRISFRKLTAGLKPLLVDDLVFANLETVVTDSNKLTTTEKAFNFRMHPNGVTHLVRAGFNVLSTANNHAIDYGTEGMRETLRHLAKLHRTGLKAAHGIGQTPDDVFTPARFDVKGATFRFAAIGIGGVSASEARPGQAHYRSAGDFDRMTRNLGAAAADYRMLSVHYGQELQVRPSRDARDKLGAMAIGDRGIDLIIGHHAHTPAGAQRVGDRLVFYGLGNLLHLGMQDMAKFNQCRDFGLFARVHLVSDQQHGGRFVARAVELYALDNMHDGTTIRSGEDGRLRIEAINYLGAELDEPKRDAAGLRFRPRADGSGLYCAPGAEHSAGVVGKLCAGWQAPHAPDDKLRERLSSACGFLRKDSGDSRIAKQSKQPGASASAKQKRIDNFARTAFQSEN